jgi:hypothetical protein
VGKWTEVWESNLEVCRVSAGECSSLGEDREVQECEKYIETAKCTISRVS